jgi:sugar phosphate isomerase/epimerase
MAITSLEGLTRRQLFAGATGLAVAGGARAGPLNAPIGLQLYAIGDAVNHDFDGALCTVAAIGYQAVESNLSFAGRDAKALKTAYSALGLAWRSAHCGGEELRGGLARTIETAQSVGLDYLVCPFPLIPASMKDVLTGIGLDDWKANADLFNRIGGQMQAAGITFAYHNHNIDFRRYDGIGGYDTLLAWTDPKLVKFELDCGWAASAGLDPVDYLIRYPDRYVMLHLKDLRRDHIPNTDLKMTSTELGKGIVDWPRLLRAAGKTSVKGLYVEQEPPFAGSSLDSVRASFGYLRALQV